MSECNCPSIADVLRGPIYTKPPCPVHPVDPKWADLMIAKPVPASPDNPETESRSE